MMHIGVDGQLKAIALGVGEGLGHEEAGYEVALLFCYRDSLVLGVDHQSCLATGWFRSHHARKRSVLATITAADSVGCQHPHQFPDVGQN